MLRTASEHDLYRGIFCPALSSACYLTMTYFKKYTVTGAGIRSNIAILLPDLDSDENDIVLQGKAVAERIDRIHDRIHRKRKIALAGRAHDIRKLVKAEYLPGFVSGFGPPAGIEAYPVPRFAIDRFFFIDGIFKLADDGASAAQYLGPSVGPEQHGRHMAPFRER